MIKRRICGLKLELDLRIPEEYEKLEANIVKAVSAANAVTAEADKDESKGTEALRALCSAIDEFVDNTFGEGTAGLLFGKSRNFSIGVRTDAFTVISSMLVEARMNGYPIAGMEKGISRNGRIKKEKKQKYNNRPASFRGAAV